MKLGTLLSGWRGANDGSSLAESADCDGFDHDPFVQTGSIANPNACIARGQYCRLLAPASRREFPESTLATAWKAFEERMTFVSEGTIQRSRGAQTSPSSGAPPATSPGRVDVEAVIIPAFYIDRCTVTNDDYLRFVQDGGYEQTDLWPEEIWSHAVRFVDETGCPGPRTWTDGRPRKGRGRHPVVGICWYEAQAYAEWAGKRLPTSEEWERAGRWTSGSDGSDAAMRYPWGNAFSPERANLWASGNRDTVDVNEYRSGSTPNGIYQLVGNVWEWIAGPFLGPPVAEGATLFFDQAMAEIRGGAFDTYFESQAVAQFRTGQPYLYRAANIGFRCAVSSEQVGDAPDPTVFSNSLDVG